MPSIYDQAQQFRANLIKRDTAAIDLLVGEYKDIYNRIVRSIEDLSNRIDEAQRNGQKVSLSWLRQQDRYNQFLNQLDREFGLYGNRLAGIVNARQGFEAQQGSNDAAAMIVQVEGSFNRLNPAAIQNIVANVRSTSPLGQLLGSFGVRASRRVAGSLRDGVALGHNPRKIAREVRDALGVPLHRALLISRTEAARAYRQAAIQNYQQSEVVTGWRWVAAKSARTCLACLALDGAFFPKDKPFPAHPACRCVMAPAFEGQKPSKRESAGDWFERQPDKVKRDMMSGAAFDAYKAGKVTLKDFVGRADSRKWGTTYHELSLKRVLAGDSSFPEAFKPKAIKAKPVEVQPVIEPVQVVPQGKPVGEALTMPSNKKAAASLQRTIDAINKVHGDGELPVIPIELGKSKKSEASYWRAGPKAQRIKVNHLLPNAQSNLAHEIGHFLDHQTMGEGGKFASEGRTPLMREFLEVAENSEAIKNLKAMYQQRRYTVDGREHSMPTTWISYALRKREIWARAYAQYISLRSGDVDMMKQIASVRESKHPAGNQAQWGDADFEPIAKAIDGIMLQLGWRK